MSPELKNDIAELKNDVGHLKDSDLEMKVHRRIRPLLSQHLGLRRARVVQSAVHQAPDDFEAKVQKAADENRITGEQEHRLVATDLILQARSSRDANTGLDRGRGRESDRRSRGRADSGRQRMVAALIILRGADQPSATSNAVTLRVLRLNSTPIRWIGSPRPRYLAA